VGDLTKGVEAGFAATVLISILVFAQQAVGLSPQFNLIAMATAFTGTNDPIMGWMFHFITGGFVYGLGFAVFSPHLLGPHWLRGATFGVLAWLVMMVAFLPSVHMPIFARGMGMTIPAASLIVHLIYGLTLGEVYHLLVHYFPEEVEEENA
jgi:uncharacterized membrane protein YagU involved in acid resistance